jgi:hypothetical protein
VGYLGAGVLAACVLSLYPSWRLMLAYLAAVLMMELIQQARYEGGGRHWGHYFLFYVGACWLLRGTAPRRRHLPSLLLLGALAAFQVQGFVAAAVWDTRGVFSGGRDTAAFIRSKNLQDLPIVGGPSWIVLTVTSYLQRPFFNAETEELHETVVFHTRRRKFAREADYWRGVLDRAIGVARERHSPVLVITTAPLPPPPAGVRLSHLFTSRRGVVSDETFVVYVLTAAP